MFCKAFLTCSTGRHCSYCAAHLVVGTSDIKQKQNFTTEGTKHSVEGTVFYFIDNNLKSDLDSILSTHQLVDRHYGRHSVAPVAAQRPDGRVGLGDLRPPRHVGVSRGDGVVGDVDSLHLSNLSIFN